MTDGEPSVRDETIEDDIVSPPVCVLLAVDTARRTIELLAEAEHEDPIATVIVIGVSQEESSDLITAKSAFVVAQELSSNLAAEMTGPPSTEPSDIGQCIGGGMKPCQSPRFVAGRDTGGGMR